MSVSLVGEMGILAIRRFGGGKGTLEVAGAPSAEKMPELEARMWRELGIERITPEQARRILRSALTAGEMALWKPESWSEILSLLAPGDAAAVMKDLADGLRSLQGDTLPDSQKTTILDWVTKVHNMMVPSVQNEGRARIVKAL